MVAVEEKRRMLITKHDLDLALEEKRALFHDDDVIDDDVYNELFLAPKEYKLWTDGCKRQVLHIDKLQREFLCQDLTTNVYYDGKCYMCGKQHRHKITRSELVRYTFKKVACYRLFQHASVPSLEKYDPQILSYEELWKLKHSSTFDEWGTHTAPRRWKWQTDCLFIDEKRLYICSNCIKTFEEEARIEAREILQLNGESFWRWYNDEQNKDDWRRKIFVECRPYRDISSDSKAFYIRSTEGVHWESEEYKEFLKQKEQEGLERQQHQQLLEEAKRQQRIDDEKERERVRRSNELFLARKQKDSPTQRYINKFCLATSDVDVANKTIIQEALNPANVEYEQIQKHNSTLYSEYLKSPLWHIISSKVKWNAGYKCEECGSTHNLHVHHISYEYKGIEFLNIGLLQCLCKDCHSKKHGK